MQPDQTPMNPAETLAALKLLEVALKGAIAAAEPAAEDYRKATRAKQLETDYGLLYVTRYKPSIDVSDAALIRAPRRIERRASWSHDSCQLTQAALARCTERTRSGRVCMSRGLSMTRSAPRRSAPRCTSGVP